MTFTYSCPYGWNRCLLPLNHCVWLYLACLTCLMLACRLLEIWVNISGCFNMWLQHCSLYTFITSSLRECWLLRGQKHIRQCCYLACVTPRHWLLTLSTSLLSLFVCLLPSFSNIWALVLSRLLNSSTFACWYWAIHCSIYLLTYFIC